jgi:hypothetical protein
LFVQPPKSLDEWQCRTELALENARRRIGPERAETKAAERLVQLYDAWGNMDEADNWRNELDAIRGPR